MQNSNPHTQARHTTVYVFQSKLSHTGPNDGQNASKWRCDERHVNFKTFSQNLLLHTLKNLHFHLLLAVQRGRFPFHLLYRNIAILRAHSIFNSKFPNYLLTSNQPDMSRKGTTREREEDALFLRLRRHLNSDKTKTWERGRSGEREEVERREPCWVWEKCGE